MATVYSLVAFGGKDGLSVTANSGTDYITLSNHGIRSGVALPVAFKSGTLPTVSGTALALDTTYYAKYISTTTFELYYEVTLTTKVNFTSNGSSLMLYSAYWATLGVSGRARHGSAGSERCYATMVAARTARAAAALAADEEVIEIYSPIDESITAEFTMSIPAASVSFTTVVNGSRSPAFPNGAINAGFRVIGGVGFGILFRFTKFKHTLDGIGMSITGNSCQITRYDGFLNRVVNCVIVGSGSGGAQTGCVLISSGACNTFFNNIVKDCSKGIDWQNNSQTGVLVANNTVIGGAGCTGFTGATSQVGLCFNNSSTGNGTANWGTQTTPAMSGSSNNAGESTGGTPWGSSAVTSLNLTTHWTDYTNSNYRPSSTSPLKDTGVTVLDVAAEDITDSLRPSYNNGGAEAWDIGAFEYDNGYGLPPSTGTLSGSGIVDGTRIKIAKQSDGTEIVNAVVSGTTKSDAYTGPNAAVYIYARKGTSATYYQPVRVSGNIVSGNLTYDLTGLQVEDIAASTYAAGVATDWTVNFTTGAIAHASGTTRYSVQDLYSYHQNLTDDSGNMSADPIMRGTTPTMFELINTGSITDGDLEDLYGGSVEFPDGDLWSNAYSVGSLSGTPNIYIYQGTTKLTQHWAAGHLDILIKAKNNGSLVESGLITGYARKWGYTYDNYQVDLSGGGRNVMPIATLADASITATEVAVGGWTDVTVTFGTYSRDFGDGDGAQTYYCEIDCNNRPLSEVYQRLQYLTREGASGTLNGVASETYQKAHSSATAVKTAPFGTYSGGFMTVAPMVWLKNVPAGESYLYVVTDSAGGTHQNDPPANGLTINDLVAGSTVRVFETGTTTIIDSTTNSGTSFVVADITGNVDYTIQKDGYLIIRVVNQAVSGATVVSGAQTVDRAFL
jgi:hypothetical protein